MFVCNTLGTFYYKKILKIKYNIKNVITTTSKIIVSLLRQLPPSFSKEVGA